MMKYIFTRAQLKTMGLIFIYYLADVISFSLIALYVKKKKKLRPERKSGDWVLGR